MIRGRRRFGALTLSMILAMVLGMMLPMVAAAQPAPDEVPAKLTIKSTSGTNTVRQGGDFIIIGESFFAEEPVDVIVTDPAGRVFQAAQAFTNTAGDFQVEFNVGGSPVGTYGVRARGVFSGIQATGQFFVVGGTTPGRQGLASIDAQFIFFRGAAPGSTFGTTAGQVNVLRIKGYDFFPNEVVSCFVTYPDGTVQFLFETVTDNSEFAAEVVFGAAPVGTYSITCVGQDSARSAVRRVELRAGDVLSGIARGTLQVNVTPNVIARSNSATPPAQNVLVVTAEGALAGEIVSFFFTRPDGSVSAADTIEVVANDAGEASIAVQFGSFNLTGAYAVTAFGNTSRFRGVASFTVNP